MKTLLCLLLLSACCSQAAVSFDASDDILGTVTNAYAGPLPLTVSAWIKAEGFSEGTDGAKIGMLLARFGFSASRGWEWFFSSQNVTYGTNTIALYVQYSTTGMSKASAPQSILSNAWLHVATTWDGTASTNGITHYINGKTVGVFGLVAGSGTYVADPALPFCLGNSSGTANTFGGQICDVATWTNVLTASEIAILANSRMARVPLQVRPAALVGYWPMDGGPDGLSVSPVNCITDLSGRGNHASPTNSPGWRASPLSYP